jgi:hypothetical protein
MTQPAGRICGLPSRHRTYLRSSPILCLADVVSLILTFIFLLCHLISPRVCLETIIEKRYDDVSDSSEGIQSLEEMTLLRWAFFIICSLPPVIKLLSLTNVPWSQAYGAMFLSSFIIIEGLAFIRRPKDLNQYAPLSMRRGSAMDPTSRYIGYLNDTILTLAFIIHISLLLWTISDIWPNPSGLADIEQLSRFPDRLLYETSQLMALA